MEYIQSALKVDFAFDDGELPKIRMIANTGAVMAFGKKKYALDVERVAPKNEKIPIVYGHNLERGIGHAEKIYVEDGKLVVEGVVSRETPWARDFVAGARNGFPWQASVGGIVDETTKIKDGETYDLHGAILPGPIEIIDHFTLYEVSVVEFGADEATETTVAQKELPMENHENELNAFREEQARELERVAEIRARSQGNDEVLQARAIREGWTPDQFELEALRAARVAPAVAVENDVDGPEVFEAVALRAAGFEPKYNERVLEAADKLERCGLREFVARASGVPYQRDQNEWLRAAFSTHNLDYVLSRSVNAILLESFNYVDAGWKKVFKVGTVSDFKTAQRYRLNSDLTYQPLADGGNIKHGEISDEAFDVKADTRAIMFSITRKDVINDDLGALTELPRQFGYAAAETINQACWSLFMNPAPVGGTAFYHATPGTLKANCPLNLENLGAARAAFVSKKKNNGSPLGIPPTLLVVPTALEDKALMLTKATLLNNGATDSTPADFNPNYGRFQVVAVPYLGYANFTNYSDTSWYLCCDPRRVAAFEIAFLNGKTAPTVERADSAFDTLGIQYRAYIDFGVSQQDQRGILKCTA